MIKFLPLDFLGVSHRILILLIKDIFPRCVIMQEM